MNKLGFVIDVRKFSLSFCENITAETVEWFFVTIVPQIHSIFLQVFFFFFFFSFSKIGIKRRKKTFMKVKMCCFIFSDVCFRGVEWGYSGPQRVCIDCFFKLAKEQELKTSTKDELMILQFFLRDSQVYRFSFPFPSCSSKRSREYPTIFRLILLFSFSFSFLFEIRMRSRDVYDMGTRTAPEKTPACAEFLDKQDSKSDHIATLISTEHAPQSLSSAQTKKNWERVLYSLDHPFLLPVLEVNIFTFFSFVCFLFFLLRSHLYV